MKKDAQIDSKISRLFRLSVICGLQPIKLTKKAKNKFKLSFSSYLKWYDMCFLVFTALLRTSGIVLDQEDGVYETGTEGLIRLVQILFYAAGLAILIFTMSFRARSLLACSQEINEFDLDLKATDRNKMDDRMVILSWSSLVLSIGLILCDLQNQIMSTDLRPIERTCLSYGALYLLQIVFMVLKIEFSVFSCLVYSRMKLLVGHVEASIYNKKIDQQQQYPVAPRHHITLTDHLSPDLNHGQPTVSSQQTQVEQLRILDKLKVYLALQGRLRRAALELSNGYGLVLLIIILIAIIDLVVTPFFLIIELGSESWKSTDSSHLVINSFWIAFYFYWFVLPVEICHRIQKEDTSLSDTFQLILMEAGERLSLAGGDTDSERRYHALEYRLQVASAPITTFQLTAFQCCVLDRALTGKVIAAMTTYTVLVMQYQYHTA